MVKAITEKRLKALKKKLVQVEPVEHSVDGIVDSYSTWLEVKAPAHLKSFRDRLNIDPLAARAEALTFNFLRMTRKNPEPGEILGKGGADFICRPTTKPEFVVEVTTLQTDAVTKASGLSSPLQVGAAVGFSQITTKLMNAAIDKANQLSGYEMARVLVIATDHEEAGLLVGSRAAEEMLTGTTALSLRIGDIAARPEVNAPLKNSVFFRAKGGKVAPARQSISAILLMQIRWDGIYVIGVLHPAPAVVFDPSTFDHVNFVRLRQWPIEERFGIEWVGPAPSPTQVPHMPMGLSGSELKT